MSKAKKYTHTNAIGEHIEEILGENYDETETESAGVNDEFDYDRTTNDGDNVYDPWNEIDVGQGPRGVGGRVA